MADHNRRSAANSVRHDIAGREHLHLALAPDTLNGHPVAGQYAEVFWLPVIGPSCLWMLRRLVAWAEDGVTVFPLAELGGCMGHGGGTGFNSPVVRSLERLVSFRTMGYAGGLITVRQTLATLSSHHLAQLPASLVESHYTYMVEA